MTKGEPIMILKRPGVNTQQTMIDKASVKEVIEFERFCRDNALWEEMEKCYAKESHVMISWFKGTGAEFVAASRKMKGRAPHKIYNTEIWLNGDKAIAIMLVSIQYRVVINGCPVELMSDAKLVFRVQKMDDLWMIQSMEGIYEKDALVPVYPNGNLTISRDELSKFRDPYACLSYVLTMEGYKVDSALPGIDQPEQVEKLYHEVNEWLIK